MATEGLGKHGGNWSSLVEGATMCIKAFLAKRGRNAEQSENIVPNEMHAK